LIGRGKLRFKRIIGSTGAKHVFGPGFDILDDAGNLKSRWIAFAIRCKILPKLTMPEIDKTVVNDLNHGL